MDMEPGAEQVAEDTDGEGSEAQENTVEVEDPQLAHFQAKILEKCSKYQQAVLKDKQKQASLLSALDKDFGRSINVDLYWKEVRKEALEMPVQE